MWKIINHRLLSVAAVMIVAASAATAQTAAGYPSKPVRFILPYAGGGAGTTTLQIFTDRLAKDTGQAFIVDNRPGGNTIIGSDAVARSAPDGYTLLVQNASFAVIHWLTPNLPFDTLKDFIGVSTLIRNDFMIGIHPSVPSNLKEFIAYARKNPGKINGFTSGPGTSNDLVNLMFMQAAGIKYTLVPYKGGGAAIADLLSGTIQMAFNSPGLFVSHIKSGKLKGLAISGDRRKPALPDVPTFAEGGLKDFIAATWYVLLAPASTPREVVEKLNAAIGQAQSSKDVQDLLAKQGIDPFPNNVAATNAFFRSELERYGKVIKDNDIKAMAE